MGLWRAQRGSYGARRLHHHLRGPLRGRLHERRVPPGDRHKAHGEPRGPHDEAAAGGGTGAQREGAGRRVPLHQGPPGAGSSCSPGRPTCGSCEWSRRAGYGPRCRLVRHQLDRLGGHEREYSKAVLFRRRMVAVLVLELTLVAKAA